jgi:hypothetical protein
MGRYGWRLSVGWLIFKYPHIEGPKGPAKGCRDRHARAMVLPAPFYWRLGGKHVADIFEPH